VGPQYPDINEMPPREPPRCHKGALQVSQGSLPGVMREPPNISARFLCNAIKNNHDGIKICFIKIQKSQ